jgi:hypothetical protein
MLKIYLFFFLNFAGMNKKVKEGIKVEPNVASTSQRRKSGKKS